MNTEAPSPHPWEAATPEQILEDLQKLTDQIKQRARERYPDFTGPVHLQFVPMSTGDSETEKDQVVAVRAPRPSPFEIPAAVRFNLGLRNKQKVMARRVGR